eukprot:2463373-Rhodomonas_salina.1
MALHPKISREAASSLWELGWQEAMEDGTMQEIKAIRNMVFPMFSIKVSLDKGHVRRDMEHI